MKSFLGNFPRYCAVFAESLNSRKVSLTFRVEGILVNVLRDGAVLMCHKINEARMNERMQHNLSFSNTGDWAPNMCETMHVAICPVLCIIIVFCIICIAPWRLAHAFPVDFV